MDNIGKNGRLPQGFSLETVGKGYKCPAGMRDGTLIYHTVNLGNPGNPVKAANDVATLLIKYFADNDERYSIEIETIIGENSIVSIVDELAKTMWKTLMNPVNPADLVKTANRWTDSTLDLITKSENMDFVKIGIILLGVVGFDDFDCSIKILCDMAKYDGLTIYAIIALSRLANTSLMLSPEHPIDYNALVFDIAQQVEGWGRVHAVERLELIDNEIRYWLLCFCCVNALLPEYLALNCANKGDMISMLRQDAINDESFEGITSIFDGLIEAEMGPGDGLCAYEQGKEALMLYIRHTKDRPNDKSDRVINLSLKLLNGEILENDDYKKVKNKMERIEFIDILKEN
jgi:hypothetical protein